MDNNSFDFNNIRVNITNFTVFHVLHMIETNKMNLFPDFQRNTVWDNTMNSRLIESLILNIPLPLFYLSENKEDVLDVVDGLQRLNAIWRYARNDFKLQDLIYLRDLNNLKMDELPLKYIQRILNSSLTFHIIDSRTSSDARFEIFRRINTAGVSLTAQEVRNSYLTPNVRSFINKLSNTTILKLLVPSINDKRMERQELIIRFFAFYESYDFQSGYLNFRGGLGDFLDRFTQELNDLSEWRLEEYYQIFTNALRNAEYLLGQFAFHRLNLDKEFKLKKHTFSKSLFVCQAVILANYNLSQLNYKRGSEEIVSELLKVMKLDKDIDRAINARVSSPKEMQFQFHIISKMIEELIENVEKHHNREF